MSAVNEKSKRDWERRADAKGALVPADWETHSTHVTIVCGSCGTRFKRNLTFGLDDPIFICPNGGCGKKNFVPITYDVRRKG